MSNTKQAAAAEKLPLDAKGGWGDYYTEKCLPVIERIDHAADAAACEALAVELGWPLAAVMSVKTLIILGRNQPM